MKHSLITVGGTEFLDRVGPLWLALRDHHARLAPQWAETLAKSFEERRAGLIAKGSGGLRVVLASANGQDIGYCLSTIIAGGEGDIDSFYVAEDFRGRGVGKTLLEKTLEWFAENRITSITVDIIAGNTEAQKFYERHGFALRTARLRYAPGQ